MLLVELGEGGEGGATTTLLVGERRRLVASLLRGQAHRIGRGDAGGRGLEALGRDRVGRLGPRDAAGDVVRVDIGVDRQRGLLVVRVIRCAVRGSRVRRPFGCHRRAHLIDTAQGLVEDRVQADPLIANAGLGAFAALVERLLVLLEAACAEKGAQQPLPVVVLREQELREASLREQDDLLELLAIHTDDVADARVDLFLLRRDADPLARVAAEQFDARTLEGRALAPLFRPLVGRSAHDAPGIVTDGEVEADAARLAVGGVVAAEPLLALRSARRRAVEREADGVEDARLARAGASRDEEDAVVGVASEIDRLHVAEGPEALDHQFLDLHACSPARFSETISAISACSFSDAPSPARTCSRKSSTICGSGVPRPTRSR
jgi:hypothetical protein